MGQGNKRIKSSTEQLHSTGGVLILSISAGEGHNKAAEALAGTLQRTEPFLKVYMEDVFSWANPGMGKFIIGIYMQMLKYVPSIYRHLYALGEKKGVLRKTGHKILNGFLNRGLYKGLLALLNKKKPQVVVCTHPFPLAVAGALKKRVNIPLIAIITDFTVHPLWILPQVDLFTVATEKQGQELCNQGISPEKILVSGIPVDLKFARNIERKATATGLGIDPDMLTLLIMGGGQGFGPLEELLKTLKEMSLPLQILVVGGKNKALLKRLHEVAENIKTIRIYGFVDHIDELMSVSDLIVTKPGGLTCAEAMAKGLPIFAISPLPGQEERNLRFLTNLGTAYEFTDIHSLTQEIKNLLDRKEVISEMRAKAKAYGRPDAARIIAEAVAFLAAKRGD